MSRTLQLLTSISALCWLAANGCLGVDFYVAPGGNDANPGTEARPFRTLPHARDVVRGVNGSMSADIRVFLRSGAHVLEAPLLFTAADSGTNGYQVVYQAYPGEQPSISGGARVSGWSLFDAAAGIWRAPFAPNHQTRQFFVNGVRAQRAATSVIPALTMTATGYTTTDPMMASWSHADGIEFVYTGSAGNSVKIWTECRCGVQSMATSSGTTTITMQNPGFGYAVSRYIQTPTAIENVFEALDQPGEWYHDRIGGYLYYKPRVGEDLATAVAIAPLLPQLIVGQGTPGAPITHLRFTGLVFSYTTWLGPSSTNGYAERQAGLFLPDMAKIPAAVAFTAASQLLIDGNLFAHLGGSGLDLAGGCHAVTVRGNVFTDLSGGGVQVGDVQTPLPADPALEDRGNRIENNYLHDFPVEYHGAVPIFCGYVADTLIAHNEVANCSYTGISLGWGWGTASFAENNEIVSNHVHHVMSLLDDGGGIYTLSQQKTTAPGSSIHHNHIADIPSTRLGRAIYPDEGSAWFDIHHNVVSNVPTWLYIWTSSIHDLSIHDNWTGSLGMRNDGVAISLVNNLLAAAPWPADAQAVIDSAGLAAPFIGILTTGNVVGDGAPADGGTPSDGASGSTATSAGPSSRSCGIGTASAALATFLSVLLLGLRLQWLPRNR